MNICNTKPSHPYQVLHAAKLCLSQRRDYSSADLCAIRKLGMQENGPVEILTVVGGLSFFEEELELRRLWERLDL